MWPHRVILLLAKCITSRQTGHRTPPPPPPSPAILDSSALGIWWLDGYIFWRKRGIGKIWIDYQKLSIYYLGWLSKILQSLNFLLQRAQYLRSEPGERQRDVCVTTQQSHSPVVQHQRVEAEGRAAQNTNQSAVEIMNSVVWWDEGRDLRKRGM